MILTPAQVTLLVAIDKQDFDIVRNDAASTRLVGSVLLCNVQTLSALVNKGLVYHLITHASVTDKGRKELNIC